MTEDERLEEYLRVCLATHDYLVRRGRWPWPESTDDEDLVESDSQPQNL